MGFWNLRPLIGLIMWLLIAWWLIRNYKLVVELILN